MYIEVISNGGKIRNSCNISWYISCIHIIPLYAFLSVVFHLLLWRNILSRANSFSMNSTLWYIYIKMDPETMEGPMSTQMVFLYRLRPHNIFKSWFDWHSISLFELRTIYGAHAQIYPRKSQTTSTTIYTSKFYQITLKSSPSLKE